MTGGIYTITAPSGNQYVGSGASNDSRAKMSANAKARWASVEFRARASVIQKARRMRERLERGNGNRP